MFSLCSVPAFVPDTRNSDEPVFCSPKELLMFPFPPYSHWIMTFPNRAPTFSTSLLPCIYYMALNFKWDCI